MAKATRSAVRVAEKVSDIAPKRAEFLPKDWIVQPLRRFSLSSIPSNQDTKPLDQPARMPNSSDSSSSKSCESSDSSICESSDSSCTDSSQSSESADSSLSDESSDSSESEFSSDSSSDSSSSDSSVSSEESSSSSGGITLDEDSFAFTNADAGDYDSKDIGYTNNTGTTVASAEIVNISGGNSEDEQPVKVIKVTPDTITLQATTKTGASGDNVTRGIKFKGSDGTELAILTFHAEVMKTLGYALKVTSDDKDYSADIESTIDAQFSQNGAAVGFNSPTAGATIGATAKAEVKKSNYNAALRISFADAIKDLPAADNVSLSLSTGVTVSVEFLRSEFGVWSLSGSWRQTWGVNANNSSSQGEISVNFKSIDRGQKEANFEFSAGVRVESSKGNGQSSNGSAFIFQGKFKF